MTPLVWIRNIVVLALSLFFLIFGVSLMIGAFKMDNPIEFVMTLFSASFVILFCIVGLIFVFFRFFPQKSKDGLDHAETK
jgi:TRAP-type C4-dicarboxylate transport system permease small subunit